MAAGDDVAARAARARVARGREFDDFEAAIACVNRVAAAEAPATTRHPRPRLEQVR